MEHSRSVKKKNRKKRKLNAVKKMLKDREVRALIIDIIRAIIKATTG